MLTDLGQFRGNDSHGTIICGESLVYLGHIAADCRAFLQQVYIIP